MPPSTAGKRALSDSDDDRESNTKRVRNMDVDDPVSMFTSMTPDDRVAQPTQNRPVS